VQFFPFFYFIFFRFFCFCFCVKSLYSQFCTTVYIKDTYGGHQLSNTCVNEVNEHKEEGERSKVKVGGNSGGTTSRSDDSSEFGCRLKGSVMWRDYLIILKQ
jgi:hypothetical protein